MTKQVQETIDAIGAGVFDDDFDQIYAALKDRQRTISRRNMSDFHKNDHVIFTEKVRDSALRGMKATIEETPRENRRRKKLLVRVEEGVYSGRQYSCSAAILEKVS